MPYSHWRLRCTTDNCVWAEYVTVVDDPGRLPTAVEFRVLLREHCDRAHVAVKHPTGFVVRVDDGPTGYADITL